LYGRHEDEVGEMQRRGYQHRSDLDVALAVGACEQSVLVDTLDRQRALLAAKPCPCGPARRQS
jgi:hypothetical protein